MGVEFRRRVIFQHTVSVTVIKIKWMTLILSISMTSLPAANGKYLLIAKIKFPIQFVPSVPLRWS